MNNFHLKRSFATAFYGAADSFPNWLFKLMAGEPKKSDNFEITYAPYPLRKIEAKINDTGYDVIVVSPKDIPKFIGKAKILGIHTVNPLGLASTPALRQMSIDDEEYSVKYFRALLEDQSILDAKRDGLKIIVGGAGAWQIHKNPKIQKKFGIDCVVVGEAEKAIPDIIKKGIEGKRLPSYFECTSQDIPDITDIPTIKKASNYGCVEIGRGCIRGCKFCEVTKNKLRWVTLKNIQTELKINKRSGINQGLLHAEDILLYGQSGVVPDVNKLLKLFKLVKKYYHSFHLTHFSLAAVSAEPKTIPKCMDLILEDQNFILGEAGIETGSIRLLSKTMSGKIKPFEKEKWTETIHNSLGILHDNSFIPYCSLILGLPGEHEEDILHTLDLLDDLKEYRCLFLPGNFAPLGKFADKKGFSAKLNTIDDLHKQIIGKCIVHNTYWVNDIRYKLFQDSKYKPFLHMITKVWMKQYERKARKFGLLNSNE